LSIADNDNGRKYVEVLRDRGVLDHRRSSRRRQPFRGGPAIPPLIADRDRLTKADHVVKAETSKMLIPLLITEASVGQDRYAHAIGHALGEVFQEAVLVRVAVALEVRLLNGLPQQRSCSPVVRDQIGGDRRMAVL